ncbi:MAG: hypothetical protein Q9192_002565 [Flavoplaca navasiana]
MEENKNLETKFDSLELQTKTLETACTSSKRSRRHGVTIDELRKLEGQQKCTVQQLNDPIRILEAGKLAMITAGFEPSSRFKSNQAREAKTKPRQEHVIERLRRTSELCKSKKLRDTSDQIAIDALKEEIKNKDGQMKVFKAGSGAVDNLIKTSMSAYEELPVQYGISQAVALLYTYPERTTTRNMETHGLFLL